MRTRTTAVLLLAAALAAGCSSQPTYDQIADQCIAAVNALPKGAQSKPRPKECERIKDQDYNVIFASKVMDDMGWTDPTTGKFDRNRMLTSTPSP